MRTDFTTAFQQAKNQTEQEPVNLLKVEWPEIRGLPAKTLRLSDRAITAAGQDWLNLIDSWGNLALVGNRFASQSGTPVRWTLSVLNGDADLGGVQEQSFSDLFNDYPPEAATFTLYQWFEGVGLVEADLAAVFVGAPVEAVDYDEASCQITLSPLSGALGETVIGRLVNTIDYPNAPNVTLGKTLPVVLGEVENCPGLPVRIAEETEIASVAIPGDTVLKVLSTDGFPSAGQLSIDNNFISYTGKTSTSFTGCQTLGEGPDGLARTHYNGERVLQKISDHRYVFCDPAYPIANISNVRIAGDPADSNEYTVDIASGEVTFNNRPKKVVSNDSRFLEMQFDAVGGQNTAINASAAFDPEAVTSHATINQNNPKLQLVQTNDLADRGEIFRVFLAVEHYEEEKLPNDTLVVSLPAVGVLGELSRPNADDAINVGGTVDIEHNHLETIGGLIDIEHETGDTIEGDTDIDHPHTEDLDFPLIDQDHVHQITSDGEVSEIQKASSGVDAERSVNLDRPLTLIFPSFTGTALRAEYIIQFDVDLSSGLGSITLEGEDIYKIHTRGRVREFINQVTVEDNQGTSATIRRAGGLSAGSITVKSCTRRLIFEAQTTGTAEFTGTSTQKTGEVSELNDVNRPMNKSGGVNTIPVGTQRNLARSGQINSYQGNHNLNTGTLEKSSRAVIEYFDVTPHVSGWDWFQNQVVEVEYAGSVDGRSSYINHVFFEVEFAVPRYQYTDEITADIQGVKDDSLGTITGTPDALIERPDHVFHWSLAVLLNLPPTAIDTASFASAGTAFSNAVSGGFKFGGTILEKRTLKSLWQEWGRESRAALSWDAIGRVRLRFLPLNDSEGVVPDKTIDLSNIRRDPQTGRSRVSVQRSSWKDIVNHVDLLYRYDAAIDGFLGLCSDSDLTSQDVFGPRENPALFQFRWVRNEDMARNLAGFYLKERAFPMAHLEVEVFLDQVELECGDNIAITAPLDNLSASLARVLDVERVLGSGTEGEMDALRLRLRLYPQIVIRKSLMEGPVEISDVLLFVLVSLSSEDADVTETMHFVFEWQSSETTHVVEALDLLLSPFTAEVIEGQESERSLMQQQVGHSVSARELSLVPGQSGGYGIQPYAVSGYGGKETLHNPVFRFWLREVPEAAETMDFRLIYEELTSIYEFAYTGNELTSGYGLQSYGASAYGGRQALV